MQRERLIEEHNQRQQQQQQQQQQNPGQGNGMNNGGRPFQLHLPVAAPVESEIDRRKRKFKEYLSEQGPGLDYEQGVGDVSHHTPYAVWQSHVLIEFVLSIDTRASARFFYD